ncbi:hypothetical protein [Psychrobacter sp. DAB_AL32B]|uniref:hypothetical protein n=1 Tax=Psychrobacter sp. DAB_AL32B TaxID=1028414 RepID=UPI0013FE116D|nr:hypothetical protein [Psychrobacter sp. DAB_AL32B]
MRLLSPTIHVNVIQYLIPKYLITVRHPALSSLISKPPIPDAIFEIPIPSIHEAIHSIVPYSYNRRLTLG